MTAPEDRVTWRPDDIADLGRRVAVVTCGDGGLGLAGAALDVAAIVARRR